ncbi:MAG TPA: DUF2948 family protein [Caulobacteraceae bacterium]|nr:DUF2948 family protein [Caulobacteraceae bacterium]
MSAPRALKLLAQDAEDLAVISAALQDAVARVEDIHFEKKAHQLTIAFNRYCWERHDKGTRVRSGLQLGCVFDLKARAVPKEDPQAVLELLALAFEPGEAPGGRISLAFAGGADLVAEVECIDVALADVGEPWAAPHKPKHAA